jgi:hypothetical protein
MSRRNFPLALFRRGDSGLASHLALPVVEASLGVRLRLSGARSFIGMLAMWATTTFANHLMLNEQLLQLDT